jgi:hypothetical protein
MAAIPLVGDDAVDGRADLMLDIGDDSFQRVAVVWISRKHLRVAITRRCFIWVMRSFRV